VAFRSRAATELNVLVTRPALNPDGMAGSAYADPVYARSLVEFGDAVELERSGGWALSRTIPGTPHRDAMGCYPLFACRDWDGLGGDLASMPGDPVSLVLVTDPFAAPSEEQLTRLFDVVRPYKAHFLVDLSLPPETSVARHHRKSARKALDRLTFQVCDPATQLDTWQRLYEHIVDKHRVTGIRAFSREAFEIQSRMKGATMLTASLDGEVVGMHWYLTSKDVVYGHLAALHPDAYRVYASHGLFWTAIQHFRERYRWLDLGAAAGGTSPTSTDGLSQFKAAWSSATAPTFLCGKVVDRDRYRVLSRDGGAGSPAYFPAYRAGEFA